MWLLSFLPNALLHFIITSILFTGIVIYILSFFTKFIPTLLPYVYVTRIIASILICVGLYLYGSYSTEIVWRDKVTKIQEQIKISEEKSKIVNTEIKLVYIDKIKIVKETQVVIQKQISEAQPIIDSTCIVSPEVITILNDSAKRLIK